MPLFGFYIVGLRLKLDQLIFKVCDKISMDAVFRPHLNLRLGGDGQRLGFTSTPGNKCTHWRPALMQYQ